MLRSDCQDLILTTENMLRSEVAEKQIRKVEVVGWWNAGEDHKIA